MKLMNNRNQEIINHAKYWVKMDIQDNCIDLDRSDILEHFTTVFKNTTYKEMDLFFEEYAKELKKHLYKKSNK